MSRFYLKTEIESSLRNVVLKINMTVFLDKDRTTENVQKHNICTNVPCHVMYKLSDLIYLISCFTRIFPAMMQNNLIKRVIFGGAHAFGGTVGQFGFPRFHCN
jgi:hypothetical protein